MNYQRKRLRQNSRHNPPNMIHFDDYVGRNIELIQEQIRLGILPKLDYELPVMTIPENEAIIRAYLDDNRGVCVENFSRKIYSDFGKQDS